MNNILNPHFPRIPTLPCAPRNNPLRLPCDNTPDWWDIVAYAMGAAFALVLESLSNRKKTH